MARRRAEALTAEVDLEAEEQERETQELMDAPAYRRVRGALRQVRHPKVWRGRHPAWCEGCAWQTKTEGGCVVFNSCEAPWLTNGACEAWADEEVRAEIERAVSEYAAGRADTE